MTDESVASTSVKIILTTFCRVSPDEDFCLCNSFVVERTCSENFTGEETVIFFSFFEKFLPNFELIVHN
ncbi:hypothetical protein AQUCO_01600411v1 [Aquilegia coerulea]|uniref:Uncharacterized protein n=1 Tax=Aquilegia coerulea TaxID=218851 RepID=A0A2G5DS96_AQUCA|nr:hypothetical protein AQUCO_01600411v1 [Aquilegia coerulea]